MNEVDELLDLVDANDNIVGTIKRSATPNLTKGGGLYVRAATAFIQHPDGKIWVPIRTTSKSIAPGGLDISVGAHVLSGETYDEAIVREFNEESGIEASTEMLHLVAKCKPAKHSYYFTHLYLLTSSEQPRLGNEHTSGGWLSVDELLAQIKNGAPAKSSLAHQATILKKYFETRKVSVEEDII